MFFWDRLNIKAIPLNLVKYTLFLLKSVTKEGRQVIVELSIYNFQVMLEIGPKTFYVVEDFLEIFFYNSQYSSKLNVSNSWYNIVCYCMVLISNEYGELDIKTLHQLSWFPLNLFVWRFLEPHLPVTDKPLH